MGETKQSDFAFAASDGGEWQDGLTKREYFAAMAMQGILPHSAAFPESREDDYKSIAADAVLMADTLIDELNKSN